MEIQRIQEIKQRFGIVGLSESLNRAIDVAVQVAPTDLSVLVRGESGVGKEVIPKIIHQFSLRKTKPYFAINCGAIPEGTIDSELFGHVKGSFTSAVSDHKGYFEEADGGTIFLDEVGELPLSTQVRLLRVLEAGEFIRVGSNKVQKANVRVVAATNVDMDKAIKEGRFRADLYYRLNAIPISIPPLRERKDDIPLLFRKFAKDFADRNQMPPIRLTADAAALLCKGYWRGNIRELKNFTEQISILEREREIDSATLLKYMPQYDNSTLPVLARSEHESNDKSFANEREILYQVLFDMKKDMAEMKKVIREITNGQYPSNSMAHVDNMVETSAMTPAVVPMVDAGHTDQSVKMPPKAHIMDVEEYVEESLSITDKERELIEKALEKYKGNRRLAAQELNISQRTLYRRINEYGLDNY
mgnify:CR=1 FL=1